MCYLNLVLLLFFFFFEKLLVLLLVIHKIKKILILNLEGIKELELKKILALTIMFLMLMKILLLLKKLCYHLMVYFGKRLLMMKWMH